MNNAKYLIFATKNHPLYEELKASGEKFIDLSSNADFESNDNRYQSCEAIFDFSLVDKESKYNFLRNLSIEYKAPIISDLTCYWGDYFLGKFPRIKGALSTVYYTPTKKHECYASDDETFEIIQDFMTMLSRSLHRVRSPGLGFIFARTLSLIINEAYFSLEDGLATAKDLDTALKYGVNYPLGAIEWGQKCGLNNIVMLLDELYSMSGDNRYRASLELRKLAALQS